MGNLNEHIGERYGRLVIIGTVWNEKRRRNHMLCQCDCGNTFTAELAKMKMGNVQSCGCLLKETTAKRVEEGKIHEAERKKKSEQYWLYIHARQYINMCKREYSQSKKEKSHQLIVNNRRLYWIWQSMIQRCSYPNHAKWKNYGGRGITVCDEWQTFKGFYKWAVNNGYTISMSIDRIDTNGNYEPSNCRWTDQKTQQNNKRTNHYLRINGEIHTCAEWAEILGVSPLTMYDRAKRGEYETVSYEEYRQSHI